MALVTTTTNGDGLIVVPTVALVVAVEVMAEVAVVLVVPAVEAIADVVVLVLAGGMFADKLCMFLK